MQAKQPDRLEVVQLGQDSYQVVNETKGSSYTVSYGVAGLHHPVCNCPAGEHNRRCKHLDAVERYREQQSQPSQPKPTSKPRSSMFKKATRTQIKLRLALSGPAGSGKTYSALSIASHLGQSIAVIDTESGSASRYAGIFNFDVCELSSFHPQRYIEAIQAAEEAGYDVVIIDSLSHSWFGKDGELDLVDRAKNSFAAWKDVRPLERRLLSAILNCKTHIICTLRTKTEWDTSQKDANGKMKPEKIGTAPIHVAGIDYEFDVAGELNQQHTLHISKSRCPALDGQSFTNPGRDVADLLHEWMSDGVPAPPPIDRDFLLSQTEQKMNRLGWSAKDGKLHLEQHYGKKSRQFLTDEELVEFSAHLQSQPDPTGQPA